MARTLPLGFDVVMLNPERVGEDVVPHQLALPRKFLDPAPLAAGLEDRCVPLPRAAQKMPVVEEIHRRAGRAIALPSVYHPTLAVDEVCRGRQQR
jgi:hypothetical protein